MAMDVDRRRVIGQPRFRREAERLLERLGSQEGPISHDDLVESRASAPDPELAGSPEPGAGSSAAALTTSTSPAPAWRGGPG
jgi:hypothetical protein